MKRKTFLYYLALHEIAMSFALLVYDINKTVSCFAIKNE